MKKYRFHIVIVFIGYAMLVASALGLITGLAWSGLAIRGVALPEKIFPKVAKDATGRMNNRLRMMKRLKIDVPEAVLQNCAKSGELSADDQAKLDKTQVIAVRSLLEKEDEKHKEDAETMEALLQAVSVFHAIFGIVFFVMSVAGLVLGKFLIQKSAAAMKDTSPQKVLASKGDEKS